LLYKKGERENRREIIQKVKKKKNGKNTASSFIVEIMIYFDFSRAFLCFSLVYMPEKAEKVLI